MSMPRVLLLALALFLTPFAAARTWGLATEIEDPGHAGLAHWYTALRAASTGGVARALHYGDSTIAADGIARTVRTRLQARFGNAGPGFVTAAFDPTWNQRSDIVNARRGDWALRTILFGGADGRYGLGGIVGIARTGASVRLHAVDAAGAAVPQRRVEIWHQAGVGYGDLVVTGDGVPLTRVPGTAAQTEDRRVVLSPEAGVTELELASAGGPFPLYGVVLETGAPGITWEALGVIGVGSKSFTAYAGARLAEQVALRSPDLIVVMLGGNEAGYPILSVDRGRGYVPIYTAALDVIRAGAPTASCLVMTPLDQGFVDEETGEARARPGMANLVNAQRIAAQSRGCAFWSAWDAMGGKGSALTWAGSGAMGTGDLVHLTQRGVAVIGDLLADAILRDYDRWAAETPG